MTKRIFTAKYWLTQALIVSVLCGVMVMPFGPLTISTANAAFNAQINYQGKLTTSSNVAVPDGSYNIEFKLYTVPTGGSPLWTETWCRGSGCSGSGTDNRIPVTSGLFSTLLGSTTAFTGVNFNQPLYLGINIGGSGSTPSWDGEMTPRKLFGAVPAAFVAQTLEGLNSSQFLRSDAANATSSTATFVTLNQSGAGSILDLIGQGSANVFTALSSGNVGIGTSTPFQTLSVNGTGYFTGTTTASVLNATSQLLLGTTTSTRHASGAQLKTMLNGGSEISIHSASDSTFRSGISLIRSRGTIDSPAAVALNDSLGFLGFKGDDGSAAQLPALIEGFVDGAVSSGVVPARISFVTGSNGATRAERLTIKNTGSVGVGTTTPGVFFTVNGNGYFAGSVIAGALTATSSLTIGTLTGPLQAINGVVSATSTLSPTYGGTGVSTNPTYGQLLVGNAAGGYTLTATSSLGLTSPWVTAGSNIYYTTGNVGIGTTTPTAALTVQGNGSSGIEIGNTGSAGYAGIRLNSSTVANDYNILSSAVDRNLYINRPSGLNIDFRMANVNQAILLSNGNFGIGTTTPYSKLSVAGTVVGQNFVATSTTATSTFAGGLSAGNSLLNVLQNGKVGIGTAAPTTILHIADTANGLPTLTLQGTTDAEGSIQLLNETGATALSITSSGAISTISSGIGQEMYISTVDNPIFIDSGRGLFLTANDGFDLTLAAVSGGNVLVGAGNLGVGTSSPFAKLSINGAAYITGTTTVTNLNATSTIRLGTLTGPLQAINGYVSATSTLSPTYGGTGVSTNPTYGQLLVGNAAGGYTLTATSSLGLASATQIGAGTIGQIPYYAANGSTLSATSSLYIATSGNVGVGTTTTSATLTVGGAAAVIGNTDTTQFIVRGNTTQNANLQEWQSSAGTPVASIAWNGNVTAPVFDGGFGLYALRANDTYPLKFHPTAGIVWSATNLSGANDVGLLRSGSNTLDVTDGDVGNGNLRAAALTALSGLTVASLNGPLQANDGVVSATSSVGVLYGGTGITTAPSYGQLLLGDSSGGYTLTATSSLGLTSPWATAGSNIYYNSGNVGIGTSSPGALFDITAGTSGNNGRFLFNPGSDNRTLTFTTFNTGGVSYTGIDSTVTSSGGVANLVLNASGGNVGVGTTTPSSKLVVPGNGVSSVMIGDTGFSNFAGIKLNGTGPLSSTNYNFLSGTADTNLYYNVPSGSTHQWRVSNSAIMTLLASGALGVGTTTPVGNFNVFAASTPAITLTDGSQTAGNRNYVTRVNGGVFQVFPASDTGVALTQGFSITRTGYMGVGTTTPTARLSVTGQGASTLPAFMVADSVDAPRFTVLNGGNVGIGTTSPASILDANGSNPVIRTTSIFSSGFGGFQNYELGTRKGSFQTIGSAFATTDRQNDTEITSDSGDVTIWPGLTPQVYFKSGGNVGIGTSTPDRTLNVNGNATFGTIAASTPTASPVNVSFGSTYGSNTPGSTGNLKWDLFTSGSSGTRYGIGMSLNLMEFQAGPSGAHGFFVNNGTEAVRITSTGNVGIGTSTPTIIGTALSNLVIGSASTTNNGMVIDGSSSGTGLRYGFASNGTLIAGILRNNTAGTMTFSNSSSAANDMVINSTGKIGIGTTTPSAKLSIYNISGGILPATGVDASTATLSLNSNSANTMFLGASTAFPFGTYIQSADNRNLANFYPLLFQPNGGNVGIGTTSPQQKLEIYGSSPLQILDNTAATGFSGLRFSENSTLKGAVQMIGSSFATADRQNLLEISSQTGGISLRPNGSEAFRITTAGNVGVGTTSPTTELNVASTLPEITISDTDAATNSKHWFIENSGGQFSIGTTSDALVKSTTRAFLCNTTGTCTVGNPAMSSAPLTINGGASGGNMLTLARTVGATANYSFSLGGGCLAFTDNVAGQVVTNTCGDGGYNAFFLGVRGLTAANNRPGIISGTQFGVLAGTDVPGVETEIIGSRGTGTGTPGNLKLSIGVSTGVSGSAQQATTTRIMILGSNGSIGLGTTTPLATVAIQATANQIPFLVASSTGAALFQIDQSGYVGIGTSTPTAGLAIYGSDQTTSALNTDGNLGGAIKIIGSGNSVGSGGALLFGFQNSSIGKTAAAFKLLGVNGSGNGIGDLAVSLRSAVGDSTLTERVIFKSTGNVGIGTSTPTAMLHIGSAAAGGNVKIANGYLCVDTNDTCSGTNSAGGIYSVSAATTGADLAENYTTNDTTLVAGEIVSLDPSTPGYIRRASGNDEVFGIVSTQPGVLLGRNIGNSRPVALTGRVPLKINNEGGVIMPGDRIALSSVPGVGKKAYGAEASVGMALESFNGSTGEIEVFMDRHAGTFKDSKLTALTVSGLNDIKSIVDLSQTSTTTGSVITVTSDGKVGIGTTTPNYKMQIAGDIAATAFVNVSTRTSKKDISYVGDAEKDSILAKIRDMKVAQYHYTAEATSDPKRLGLIAEEAPAEVLSADGKGVDVYKFSTFVLAGVQAQDERVTKLEQELAAAKLTLADLTTSIASTTAALPVGSQGLAAAVVTAVTAYFDQVGIKISSSLAEFKDVVVAKLTAKSVTVEEGITVKDKTTGTYYCLVVNNGALTNIPGACGSETASSTPSTPTAPTNSGNSTNTPIVTGGNSTTSTTTPTVVTSPNNSETASSTPVTSNTPTNTETASSTPETTAGTGESQPASTPTPVTEPTPEPTTPSEPVASGDTGAPATN